MIFQSEIPSEAVRININSYLVIADSETTGNHHVVDASPGVQFFEKGGKKYMRNTKPTKVRCLHKDRHDEITINPGDWEFGIQQEYDPFAENMRNVRD